VARVANDVDLRGQEFPSVLLRSRQSESAKLVAIMMVVRERAKGEKMPQLIMLEFQLSSATEIAGQKSKGRVWPAFSSLEERQNSGQHLSLAAWQLLRKEFEIEIEERIHAFLGDRLSIFRENLMRDARVCPPGDLDALQVAAESLGRRPLDRAIPRRTGANEGAVNIPEQETFFFN
jgi:hypothetical protein